MSEIYTQLRLFIFGDWMWQQYWPYVYWMDIPVDYDYDQWFG